ncbi:MAG: hypothetical protein WEA04_05025 [Candidatus Andersenbacteria bacterium]
MTQVFPAMSPAASLHAYPLLNHFKTMMGPYGLYQHATSRVPLLREGYCTDDNARAVQVLVHLRSLMAIEERGLVDQFLERCWQFLREARTGAGEYLNFRSAQGGWLPTGVSDDMYARLIRTFVTVLMHDGTAARRQQAQEMLTELLVALPRLQAPRAWAEILLSLASLPIELQQSLAAKSIISHGLEFLHRLWQHQASAAWPWFELKMTYANALLPHGLLAGLRVAPQTTYEEILHQSAQFLIKTTIPQEIFIPIGSVGWYEKGGEPSQDNQQPIEAGTMFDFLIDYYRSFPQRVTVAQVTAPYLWFYGYNTHRLALVDPMTGASFDGLFRHGPNKNCGAESLLAYLWAEILLQQAPPAMREVATLKRSEFVSSSDLT